TCRSSSGWSSGCGADGGCPEVGVRMRRSRLAPSAIPQGGRKLTPKPTTRRGKTAPTEQNGGGPSSFRWPGTNLRPRKPRLVKDYSLPKGGSRHLAGRYSE